VAQRGLGFGFRLLATVRNHRKILVIDNKVAYLGGMNIGREYAATWRDTHSRIEGPKAQDAALAFTELWNKRHDINHRSRIDLPFTANSGDDQTIFLRESKPTGIFGHVTIRDTYLEAFRKAQSHIWLTNPYFLPDHELEGALVEALERGVQLDMIVPERSNHGIVDFLARGVYDRLLAGGANIWLYRHTVIHSKTCTIDAHWSTVGSANLDGRSLINYEINMFVNDAGFAERMEEMFRDDIKNCRPARRDEFSNPGRLRLLVETLAQPIRDLI
jgi:cardiolipin synthase A/B